MVHLLRILGRRTLTGFTGFLETVALCAAVVAGIFVPSHWRPPVRTVVARQVLFTAVEAAPVVALVGALAGASLLLQLKVFLGEVGQRDLFGVFLAQFFVAELAPLAAILIVIGRSGTAITAELATMLQRGEIRRLEGQGIDLFAWLVFPRCLAASLSSLLLGVVLILCALMGSLGLGLVSGDVRGGAATYLTQVSAALGIETGIAFAAKSLLPGLLVGVICCRCGLAVGHSPREVPQAMTRAVVRSGLVAFAAIVTISLWVWR